ncbi:hypothetical protein [Bacillus paranthracis]|uniref:hypothetical protein n=1 Tax=Bacillus paranthracis TaxID=2026186 RepID=UPI0021D3B1AD|nr:hypothetical protein [Bacillus paranthracis]MCU5208857.1 hypothetical protein [Bacillus paranthracis]
MYSKLFKTKQKNEKGEEQKISPKFVRLDECLDEIYESIECNDNEKEYTIQVFTDRVQKRDDECFLGISYGVRLVKGEEIKWEESFIQTHDSAIVSDIANFNRAMLLQVCDSIALYFQQYIYKWKSVKCKIVHDFKLGNDNAFKYDPSDYRVKQNIFDEEYGNKIAITLSGWR